MTIDGNLIEANEFLAPPRLLMCIKCNEPGHIKKNCSLQYDACKRCGQDRSIGDHKECLISCHRCHQDHMSTDYKCQYLADYRRSLLNKLKEKSNLLPPNIKLFIPSKCRDRGTTNNKILTNTKPNTCTLENTYSSQNKFDLNTYNWPSLPNKINVRQMDQLNGTDIWKELKRKQEQFEKQNEDLTLTLIKHQQKYENQINKISTILKSVTQQTKYQNDNMNRCYTTIREVLPVLTSTLEIVQRIITKMNPTNTNINDSESNDIQTTIKNISQCINFINDKNEVLLSNQTKFNDLIDEQVILMTQGINNLSAPPND